MGNIFDTCMQRENVLDSCGKYFIVILMCFRFYLNSVNVFPVKEIVLPRVLCVACCWMDMNKEEAES